MNNSILRNAVVTIASFIFVISVVSAWTAPTGTAPSNNVSAPITVSATNQEKTGGLWVGSLAVTGKAVSASTTDADSGNTLVTKGYLDARIASGTMSATCKLGTVDVGASCVKTDVIPIVLGLPSYGQFTDKEVGAAKACSQIGMRVATPSELALLCLSGTVPSTVSYMVDTPSSVPSGACGIDRMSVSTNFQTHVLCAVDKAVAGSGSVYDGLGVGQTWQDVIGSRSKETEYTNTTGKPIMVNIFVACGAAYGCVDAIKVDGVVVSIGYSAVGVTHSELNAIVPAGSKYKFTNTGFSSAIASTWVELR